MKVTVCEACQSSNVPMSEVLRVDGIAHCNDCLTNKYPEEDMLLGHLLEHEPDPTICSMCSIDHGNEELKPLSGKPVCKSCRTLLNRMAVPVWVKASFAGVLIVVVLAFTLNWRFYSAKNSLALANDAFEKGNVDKAVEHINHALHEVPESEDVKTLARYMGGCRMLAVGNYAQALADFEYCEDRLPDDYQIDMLINRADILASFTKGDYTRYLDLTLAQLSQDTLSAEHHAEVASAYACLYADGGKLGFRDLANYHIERCKQTPSFSGELQNYCNNIEYRLYSKQILTFSQFAEVYPDGWTTPAAE